jgi:nucleoid DNA-binding protein
MTKRELVIKIANETGLTQMNVFDVVQRVLDHITESLRRGETIEFRDFGVFEIKTRKPRVGRNPHRPEHEVVIPARQVVKFKPGKLMKAAIAKG